jgi:hypothetical protein
MRIKRAFCTGLDCSKNAAGDTKNMRMAKSVFRFARNHAITALAWLLIFASVRLAMEDKHVKFRLLNQSKLPCPDSKLLERVVSAIVCKTIKVKNKFEYFCKSFELVE